MTFKEKVAIEHPDKVDDGFYGGVMGCPHHYGYEESPTVCGDLYCPECWNREIPEPINVKEIMEEKVIEHDGCFDCKHEVIDEDECPCFNCKGTVIPGTPEYESRPDLFEPKEPTEDLIHHPNHYTYRERECIDEMVLVFGLDATLTFCKLNAWKYRYRTSEKGGEQDMQKSDRYIGMIKELTDKYGDTN